MRLRPSLYALALGTLIGALIPLSAQAATFTVTTTADSDETCTASSCSLREAVKAANASEGDDTITFSSSLPSSYFLGLSQGEIPVSGSGQLTVTTGLTGITRPIIRGNGTSRLFNVASSAKLFLDNLTLEAGGNQEIRGGAILNNGGEVKLSRCLLNANISRVSGGAIESIGGQVTLDHCNITNNFASGEHAEGEVLGEGGAIHLVGANASIIASTFSNNTAAKSGAVLHAVSSTVSFVNSTLSGNYVGEGAGVLELEGGNLSMESCTLTQNWASSPSSDLRGGIVSTNSNVTLANSIIAGNAANQRWRDIIRNGGQIIDGGFNLIGNNGGIADIFPAGKYVGTPETPVDPRLGPLRETTLRAYVHPPLPGSPIIDAGKTSLPTDQRDLPRPSDLGSIANAAGGNGSDIGAFETTVAPQTGTTLTVTKADDFYDRNPGVCGVDNCLLRDAIGTANALTQLDGLRDYRIVFDERGVFSTLQAIPVFEGTLEIASDITLVGPKAGLLLRGFQTIFRVRTDVFRVSDLTFAYGNGTNGGAVEVQWGKTFIDRCSFLDNRGNEGGAIFNAGELTLTNSTFTRNQAQNNGGAIANYGDLRLESCTLFQNTANGKGGGLFSTSSTTSELRNSIICGNNASTNPDVFAAFPDSSSSNNLIGVDAKLAPLANNGGSTPTMALLPDSPAINAGSTTLETDQRGVPRPQGGSVDIGAYEVSSAPNDSFVVTTAADEDNGTADPTQGTGTSLREAINAANANFNRTSLTFALPEGERTITLESALPLLESDLSITGPVVQGGVTVGRSSSAASNFGIFNMTKGTISLANLTISGGASSSSSNAYLSPGIDNTGAVLTVSNCTITGNGTGVNSNFGFASAAPPTTILHNSTITGNRAHGVNVNGCRTIIDSCTITDNNTSKSFGFGLAMQIYYLGAVKIGNSIIAGNPSSSAGGEQPQDIYYYGGGTGSAFEVTAPNLLGFGDMPTGASPGQTNLTAADLHLGPLADNGGPTPTMALLKGSPAINAGSTSLETDQRGKARPFGAASDIGAFEAHVTSAPIIKSVKLTPEAPRTDDPITAVVSVNDAPVSNSTFSYVWNRTRNGKTILLPETGATLQTAGDIVLKGDIITVTVQASNVYASSEPVTASVTVVNSPITITDFDLKPRAPYSFETMVATVRTTDLDRTKPTFTFTWKKNGVVTRTFTTKSSQDLYNLRTNGLGDKGDLIEVSVMASDGESSASAGSSASIRNSIPVVESVTLSPQAPTPTSTIISTYAGRDADGDKLTRTYKWRIGTKLLKEETGSRLDLRKYTFVKAGDVVSVDVQLFDGEAYSKTLTAKVTVAAVGTSPATASVKSPSASSS